MGWRCVSDESGADTIFAGKRAPTVDVYLAGNLWSPSYKAPCRETLKVPAQPPPRT
jgi:hypothetical protein